MVTIADRNKNGRGYGIWTDHNGDGVEMTITNGKLERAWIQADLEEILIGRIFRFITRKLCLYQN